MGLEVGSDGDAEGSGAHMSPRRLVDREGEDLGDDGPGLLHGLMQIGLELCQHVGVVALDGQAHWVGGVSGAGQGGPTGSADGLGDEVASGAGLASHGLHRADSVVKACDGDFVAFI